MIRINKLNKYYNRRKSNEIHVINDVDLELPDCGMVAIFGKSGSGKTTMLNVIGGLDSADKGSVELNGSKVTPNANVARNRDIGYIFQNYNLLKDESVFDNVALALRLIGIHDREEINRRTMAALAAVGMDKYRNRLPGSLSGGQQQRVAIARAIVKNPRVILADEPTGNLDEQNTIMIIELLKQLSEDRLVLLVTHEEDLVESYCTRIIDVVDGRVVSVRDNGADGNYSGRDRHALYLGEMEKRVVSSDTVSVEYYGDIIPDVKLRLINHNGALYLDSGKTPIKLLDGSSELKIHEGKYEERKSEPQEKRLDLEELSSVKAGKCGSGFTFGGSIVNGFRTNFGKNKKLRKAMNRGLVIFAAAFVFLIANCSTVFADIEKVDTRYNKNTIFLNNENLIGNDDWNEEELFAMQGRSGIETIVPGYNNFYDKNGYLEFSFSIGNFSTYNYGSSQNKLEALPLPVSVIGDRGTLSGTADPGLMEVVVSKGMADDIIEQMGMSFIKTYDDIIGLKCRCSLRYGFNFLVSGIVDDSDRCIYFSDLMYLYFINEGLPSFYPYSFVAGQMDKYPAPVGNEIYIVVNKYTSGYVVGDTIDVNGKSYIYKGDIDVSDQTNPGNGFYIGNAEYILSDDAYWEFYRTLDSRYGVYAIYCSDVEAAASALSQKYGDSVITPDDIRQEMMDSIRTSVNVKLIFMAVIVVLMFVCLMFIMRSSMMNRIKEIGIYRAIGTSRKNIIFRFAVESILVFLLTIFIGYILASAVIWSLVTVSPLLVSVLNYPVWMAALALVFLVLISIISGTVPVFSLTSKTPAEILSKYDI